MSMFLLDIGQIMGTACMHLQGTVARVHKNLLEESWNSCKTIHFFKAEKVQGSCPLFLPLSGP